MTRKIDLPEEAGKTVVERSIANLKELCTILPPPERVVSLEEIDATAHT